MEKFMVIVIKKNGTTKYYYDGKSPKSIQRHIDFLKAEKAARSILCTNGDNIFKCGYSW